MNHVKHLKSLYEAFGRGDMPTVLGAMDPNIEWREAESNPYSPPSGEPFVGPDNVLNNLFMKLNEEWDDFTVTPAVFHDAGDHVIVEGRYSGTYKETDLENDTPFCHIWEFKGDKIIKFQQYTDTAELQRVMGVTAAAV